MADISDSGFRWRVEREVEVHIRGFVLAQVVKHGHSAPANHWRVAHNNRRADCYFADEPGEIGSRRQSREWRDRAIFQLRGVGIWSSRPVADVASRFDNEFPYTNRRCSYDSLTSVHTRNTSQLFH